MDIAALIGMAYATVPAERRKRPTDAAVSMPTTRPDVSTRGPPESPGWIGALISMSPLRVSALPPPWSLAVIVWLRVVTPPRLTAGPPPRPRAFPPAAPPSPAHTAG